MVHIMIAARVVLLALVCHAGILTKQLSFYGTWDAGSTPNLVLPDSGQLIYDNDSPATVRILGFEYDPTLRMTGMYLVIECSLLGLEGLFGLHTAVLAGNYADEIYDAETHSYVPAHATTATVLRSPFVAFTETFNFHNLGVDEEASSVAFVVRPKHDIDIDPTAVVTIASVYLEIYYEEADFPWGLLSTLFRWTPTEIQPYAYDPDTGSATLAQYSGGYYDESETWDTLFLHLRFNGGTFYVRVAFLYIPFYTAYLHEDSCLFATPTPCGQIVHVVDGIAHVPIARSDMIDNGGADHYVGIIHADPGANFGIETTSTTTTTTTTHCCQYQDVTACDDTTGCAWDWTFGGCRLETCRDFFTANDCNAAAPGCVYNTQLSQCQLITGDEPCAAFYTQETCPSDRCTYSTEFYICYETPNGIPCGSLYSSELCQSPRCTFTPFGNFHLCLRTDACDVIYLNNGRRQDSAGPEPAPLQCCRHEAPGACTETNVCAWDWTVGACRPSTCQDIFVRAECVASPLGCVYDAALSQCGQSAGDQPCGTYTSAETCPSDRCTYNASKFICYETASGIPCGVFYSNETCPAPKCQTRLFPFPSCVLADACSDNSRQAYMDQLSSQAAHRNRRSNPLTELIYSRVVYGMTTPTDACCLLNETMCGDAAFCMWDTQNVSTGEQYSTCRAITCLDTNVGPICEALGCCWWGGECFNAVPCITAGDPPVCVHATDELCAESDCSLPFSCELMSGDGNNTLCHVRSGDPCSWHNATTCPIERCRIHNNTDCVELCDLCCRLETEAQCMAVASSCVWHAGVCQERECWFYSKQECPSETCTTEGTRCVSPTQKTPCSFFEGEGCPAYYCYTDDVTGACTTLGAPNCAVLNTSEACALVSECAWHLDACRFVDRVDCDVTPVHFVWPVHEVCCGLSPVECGMVVGCIWHDAFGSCMQRQCSNDGSCYEPCTSVDEGICHQGDSSLCMNLRQSQCAAPYCTFDIAADKCRDARHLPYCGMYTAEACPLDRCALTNETQSLEPQCVYSPDDCISCCDLSTDSSACEDANCMMDATTNRCRAKTCADYSIEDNCPGHCIVLSGNGQSPMLADCVSFYEEPVPCHKRYASESCTSPCQWNTFAGTCTIKSDYNCGQLESSEDCSTNEYCTFSDGLCRSSNDCPDLLPVERCCVHLYAQCQPPYCGYNFQRNLCESLDCVHYYTDEQGCLAHGGCQMDPLTEVCGKAGGPFCDVFPPAETPCPAGCVLNETLQFCRYPDYARPVCGAYWDLDQCQDDGCGIEGGICVTTCDTPFWSAPDTTTPPVIPTTPVDTISPTTSTTTTLDITLTPTATPTPCCEYDSENCYAPRCGYNFAHGLCEPMACVHYATNNASCLAHGGCHMLPVYSTHLCAPENVSVICNVYPENSNCPAGCLYDTVHVFCPYPDYTVQICGVFSTQQICESFNCTWRQPGACTATCLTPPAEPVSPPNITTTSTLATASTSSFTSTTPDEQTGATSTETSTVVMADVPYASKTTAHNMFRIASFVTIGCALVVLALAAVFWTRAVKSPRIISLIKRVFS